MSGELGKLLKRKSIPYSEVDAWLADKHKVIGFSKSHQTLQKEMKIKYKDGKITARQTKGKGKEKVKTKFVLAVEPFSTSSDSAFKLAAHVACDDLTVSFGKVWTVKKGKQTYKHVELPVAIVAAIEGIAL